MTTHTDGMSLTGWYPETDEWQPMATAPTDGPIVEVKTSACEGLPSFTTLAGYHPSAGWCVDELREAVGWRPRLYPSAADCYESEPDIDATKLKAVMTTHAARARANSSEGSMKEIDMYGRVG